MEQDVKEYPDAGHSFLNRHDVDVPLSYLERNAGFGYRHPSAENTWALIGRFFDMHLRPRRPSPGGPTGLSLARPASNELLLTSLLLDIEPAEAGAPAQRHRPVAV